MKKQVVFLMVLLFSLTLAACALAAPLPPQAAGDVSVPAYAVPVITNVVISGSTITVDATGVFNDGGVIIYITTPSGTAQDYETLTVTGSGMTGTITSLPPDTISWELSSVCLYDNTGTPDFNMNYFYDSTGTLEAYAIQQTSVYVKYNFDNAGRLHDYHTDDLDAYYNSDGSLQSYTVETLTGQQEYDGQYRLTYESSKDPVTNVSTVWRYEDGVLVYRAVRNPDDSRYEYNGQGVLRSSRITNSDGSETQTTYDVNGNLQAYAVRTDHIYELFDAAGNLIKRITITVETNTYEEFENGRQVYRSVSGVLPDGVGYEDVYENGVYIKRILYEEGADYSYDPDGNYLGKTIFYGDEWQEYNAAGVLTGYSVYSEQQGGVWLTYNHRHKLLTLEYNEPYFHFTYMYDAKEKQWYLNGVLYDGPAPISLRDLVLDKEIVWYPNNTVCSFGPQFRDVKPGLTDKWYMFTPIDLSHDGTQTFELVGGSVYVLGQVNITVSGDSVTVTYSTVKGKYGHIYMKSEYLNFFKDLASVTDVEPEKIGEGFRFGQTISIQKDLGGDTNVLMFVRNVATFRNMVDGNTPLRRFYKNLPGRVKLRDAMLALMD